MVVVVAVGSFPYSHIVDASQLFAAAVAGEAQSAAVMPVAPLDERELATNRFKGFKW